MYGCVDARVKVTNLSGQLAGRLIVVVGGTTGLGRALAREAADRGADVLVVGSEFFDQGVPRIKFVQADLSVVEENARLGSDLPACAAVTIFANSTAPTSTKRVSPDGIELQIALSALSPHVILKGLAPRLGSRSRVVLLNHVGSGNPGVLGDLNCEENFSPGLGQTRMNAAAASEALIHFYGSPAGGSKYIFGLNPGHIESERQPPGGVFKGSAFSRTMRISLGTTPEDFSAHILPLLVSPLLDRPELLPLPVSCAPPSSTTMLAQQQGKEGGGEANEVQDSAGVAHAACCHKSSSGASDEGVECSLFSICHSARSSLRRDNQPNAASPAFAAAGAPVAQRHAVAPLPILLNAAGAAILPTREFLEDASYVQRWLEELDGLARLASTNRLAAQKRRRAEQEQAQQEQQEHAERRVQHMQRDAHLAKLVDFLGDEEAAAALLDDEIHGDQGGGREEEDEGALALAAFAGGTSARIPELLEYAPRVPTGSWPESRLPELPQPEMGNRGDAAGGNVVYASSPSFSLPSSSSSAPPPPPPSFFRL